MIIGEDNAPFRYFLLTLPQSISRKLSSIKLEVKDLCDMSVLKSLMWGQKDISSPCWAKSYSILFYSIVFYHWLQALHKDKKGIWSSWYLSFQTRSLCGAEREPAFHSLSPSLPLCLSLSPSVYLSVCVSLCMCIRGGNWQKCNDSIVLGYLGYDSMLLRFCNAASIAIRFCIILRFMFPIFFKGITKNEENETD